MSKNTARFPLLGGQRGECLIPDIDATPERWNEDFWIPTPRAQPYVSHLGWGLDPQGQEALKPGRKQTKQHRRRHE